MNLLTTAGLQITGLAAAHSPERVTFLPGVPISHSPPAIVLGKDVTGVKASPLTEERFVTAEFKS